MRTGWFETQRQDLRPGDKVTVEWESWDPAAQPSKYFREEPVYDTWTTVTIAGPADVPFAYTLMPDGWHEFEQRDGETWAETQVMVDWRPGPHGVIVLSAPDATPLATAAARATTAPTPVQPAAKAVRR